MATPEEAAASPASATLEAGAYEIIQARLQSRAQDLRARLETLNGERQAVFGTIATALLATERVATVNSCVPRDLAALGPGHCLFGYNVHFGLRSRTDLEDVFAIYAHDPGEHTFQEAGLDRLRQGQFPEHFAELYRYYKETQFHHFLTQGPFLYMAFRIGKTVHDLKVFKWRIEDDGRLRYLGNRFDHEYVFPPRHEFEWRRVTRAMFREGLHPHVSIEDRVFVECVGGDLTIKVEDNTDSGEGIYSEPVSHLDQTLQDAEISYATAGGLILLRILPYQEKAHRYLIFNEKDRSVTREDRVAEACVLLPEGHGVLFPGGYQLQTGETKRFEGDFSGLEFLCRHASPNGEDHLFVFHQRTTGLHLLMSYNVIARAVETPMLCHGYAVFPNGELVCFTGDDQPQKHHALQVWRTPYLSADIEPPSARRDSYLYKVGNASLVRGMADCQQLLLLLGKQDSYAGLYHDIARQAGDIADNYFWSGRAEAGNLRAPLLEIKQAAESALAEFDKVSRIRRATSGETKRLSELAAKATTAARNTRPDDILGFVHRLAELRGLRGEIVALRDLRYADLPAIESLEKSVAEATDSVSAQCVDFLLKPEALQVYRDQIAGLEGRIPGLGKVTEAEAVAAEMNRAGGELEMLIDIVSNLKIDDATVSTQVIDDISVIYALLNQARTRLQARRREMALAEGAAQFGAQLKLLSQTTINYLNLCDSPEKCDDYLSKLMVQLEELEGQHVDIEEHVAQLIERRDEIHNAFEAKKLSLTEARGRRASGLLKSADRILQGARRRLEGLRSLAEINGYLAGDLMIAKVRDIIADLQTLGDSVKAGELQARLKSLQDEAVRQLRDRQDLFAEGPDIIQLGGHRFSVNRQKLELSLLPRDGVMHFHLAGTNFFEAVHDPVLDAGRPCWDQESVAETPAVYRGEYLAWRFSEILLEPASPSALSARDWLELEPPARLDSIRQFMAPRHAEGYTRGVHDHDAAVFVEALLRAHLDAGLLRHPPEERALALLFWSASEWSASEAGHRLERALRAHGLMRRSLHADTSPLPDEYMGQMTGPLSAWREQVNCPRLRAADAGGASRYLCEELARGGDPVASAESGDLARHFGQFLDTKGLDPTFAEALAGAENDALARYGIHRDWLEGYLLARDVAAPLPACLVETAALLSRGAISPASVRHATFTAPITGLQGMHPLIDQGGCAFDYLAFVRRLRHHDTEVAPRFLALQHRKTELIEARREAMRLSEFQARTMSGFVRNRLLDQVYLPLIGANLAKQIGTAGENTRTDRMGMLLLISPPGYGKTTLMEYVAERIGITFMKINGPAIGHGVTSLDPAEAPNASAREEVRKLNLALEMGDNVMIYVDDIQHCHTEFLQKFISLCDAQRKIEGVWNGQPRTYDLRGRKVCVVMAGNPYTESGGRFRIPDMLANRADTYNLGDLAGSHRDAFEDSFVENSLTSNAILARVGTRSPRDIHALLRAARQGSREGLDVEGSYSPEELDEILDVLGKLLRVRSTLLRVNQEYIRSAAMEDAYRTEPPFKLQGSYRNMNRIAEKVRPIMTGAEVDELVLAHYLNEAQTLTTGAEANLLRFRELEGLLTSVEQERWAEIKRRFGRNLLMAGGDEKDPVARVTGVLGTFGEGLSRIETVLRDAATVHAQPATLADATAERLEKIIGALRAVPVEVVIKVVPVHDLSPEISKGTPLPVEISGQARQDL